MKESSGPISKFIDLFEGKLTSSIETDDNTSTENLKRIFSPRANKKEVMKMEKRLKKLIQKDIVKEYHQQ